MFSLFHSTAVSESSYYEVEVVMLSPDSEALINIIYDEWSVIICLALLENCEHCGPEPAMVLPISQAQIILNCSPLPSISLSLNTFKHPVLLHLISLKAFSNIFFLLLLWFTVFFFNFLFIFIIAFSLNPAVNQLHPLIKSQQITQHPQIQINADCYTIDNKWFIFNELHSYIQSLKLRQWEIVCYVLIDTLHFWYQELEFMMFFFYETIFHDLYPAVLKDVWLKEWNKDIQAISHHWKNNITTVQTVFLIWICFFMMHWYKMEFSKVINHLCSLTLCTQSNQCKKLQNEVLTQTLAVMIGHLKHTDNVKSCCWWQPADFEWLMQNKKGFWMNDHMPQILNDNFNVFSLSDFCHQSLIFVLTADAGCTSTLTATPESHHSQPLESMVISTLTIFYR